MPQLTPTLDCGAANGALNDHTNIMTQEINPESQPTGADVDWSVMLRVVGHVESAIAPKLADQKVAFLMTTKLETG